jgi:hypothetical protein
MQITGKRAARGPTEGLLIYPGKVVRAGHDKYLLDLRRHVAPFRKIRSRPHPGPSALASLCLRLWGRQTHLPRHHTTAPSGGPNRRERASSAGLPCYLSTQHGRRPPLSPSELRILLISSLSMSRLSPCSLLVQSQLNERRVNEAQLI